MSRIIIQVESQGKNGPYAMFSDSYKYVKPSFERSRDSESTLTATDLDVGPPSSSGGFSFGFGHPH